jgi:hypothetical protein
VRGRYTPGPLRFLAGPLEATEPEEGDHHPDEDRADADALEAEVVAETEEVTAVAGPWRTPRSRRR